MNAWAQGEGQPGLGNIFWRDGEEGGAGRSRRMSGRRKTEALREQLGLKVGDAAFFVAGDPKVFYKFAGLARNKVADELNLADKDQFKFCWIVDFPMYEWSEEEKRIDFSHNPFSMPNYDHEAFLKLDPNDRETIEKITAFQYDIVCNGVELSSGAIRNHKPEIMIKAFETRRLSAERRGRKVRRHAERVPLWRAAARWFGAGRGPDRHAARGRRQYSRSDRLPVQSAGAGPDDERAGRSDGEAAERAAHPDCRADEELELIRAGSVTAEAARFKRALSMSKRSPGRNCRERAGRAGGGFAYRHRRG